MAQDNRLRRMRPNDGKPWFGAGYALFVHVAKALAQPQSQGGKGVAELAPGERFQRTGYGAFGFQPSDLGQDRLCVLLARLLAMFGNELLQFAGLRVTPNQSAVQTT